MERINLTDFDIMGIFTLKEVTARSELYTKKLDFENSLLVVVDTHKESYLAVPDIASEFDSAASYVIQNRWYKSFEENMNLLKQFNIYI